MRIALIPIIIICTLISCTGQEKDDKNWVLKSANEITSIDPANLDYNDLGPLKLAIGNAKMVLLGEQEHGDGSTYLAKSRLVKFLHNEMGFDVLAFEGDFFGMNKAWTDYKNGKKEYQDVLDQMYIFWPQSQMCQDLFRTVEQSQQTNNPIDLAGFDCQQLSGVSKNELIPSLDSILSHHDISVSQSEMDFFNATLKEAMNKFHDQEISSEDQNRWLTILEVLSGELKGKKVDPFWIQELDNLKGFIMHTWHWWIDRENHMVNNNYRDLQMAKNSLWLLNEKYKEKKIIIWVANGHLAKTDTLYEVESKGWKPDIRQFPMGEVLFDSLKDQMYTLGFTSFKGQSTYLKYDRETEDFLFIPEPFESADSTSLEYELKRTGYDYVFLNLKHISDPWLTVNRRMRIWRPEYVRGKLPDIYDGIFYIEAMKPNEKI